MRACDNPFSTTKVERTLGFDPQLNGTSWEAIESRWLELGKRAALIGPHGAGKTTFIDAFAKRLHARGVEIYRLFLNTEASIISSDQWHELSNCQGKVVILDGEEQLSFLQRRRFYKLTHSATGVLISRHSKGKLPSLLDFTPRMETLEHCVKMLAPAHYEQLAPSLDHWWIVHRGNIREILLRCYDRMTKIDHNP